MCIRFRLMAWDVMRLNLLAALQVGYGASHLEDTIVGSGGEVEAVHGGL